MAISIELDKETDQQLRTLALRTGKSAAILLKEMIARGLDDLEDLDMAEATMERVMAGAEPVYSAEQVRKNLGLGL